MKTPPSLSDLLRRAVNQRIAAQEKMKTKRTDHAEIFGSIGMVQQFLYRYPFASDERVREWCRENRGARCAGVHWRDGYTSKVDKKLKREDALATPKPNAVVIQLNTKHEPAA